MSQVQPILQDNPTFDLFTTLRYDPILLSSDENTLLSISNPKRPTPFYMLQYHVDRLRAAAEYFDWEAALARLEDEGTLLGWLEGEVEAYLLARNGGPSNRKEDEDKEGNGNGPLRVCNFSSSGNTIKDFGESVCLM